MLPSQNISTHPTHHTIIVDNSFSQICFSSLEINVHPNQQHSYVKVYLSDTKKSGQVILILP